MTVTQSGLCSTDVTMSEPRSKMFTFIVRETKALLYLSNLISTSITEVEKTTSIDYEAH